MNIADIQKLLTVEGRYIIVPAAVSRVALSARVPSPAAVLDFIVTVLTPGFSVV
jgi:hypothetical protein